MEIKNSPSFRLQKTIPSHGTLNWKTIQISRWVMGKRYKYAKPFFSLQNNTFQLGVQRATVAYNNLIRSAHGLTRCLNLPSNAVPKENAKRGQYRPPRRKPAAVASLHQKLQNLVEGSARQNEFHFLILFLYTPCCSLLFLFYLS